jgi:predicted XRE-type DNA-binding protein
MKFINILIKNICKVGEKMNYCAIIGDIVGSKQIKNRNKLQNKIKRYLKEINCTYKGCLVADFKIYAGDEIQGLINKPSLSYEIVKKINKKFSPIKLYFGVGIGEISTKIFPNSTTWDLDGKAYHRAREMINKSKKEKFNLHYLLPLKSTSNLINSLLHFIELNKKNRTQRQKEIIKIYEKYNNQQKVASHFNISQSSVSQILSKGLYYEVKQSTQNIIKYLKEFN